MRAVDNSILERWRQLGAAKVLLAVADHAKRDTTFEPTKDACTERWHVAYGSAEFELLVCRQKFFDTRARRGGGGAVDLLMHLSGKSFKQVTLVLTEAGL